MRSSLRLGILGILGCGLIACTSTIEDNELLVQAAVQHATYKVIEAGPDSVARAGRVFDIATDARSLLSGETVSLPQLELAVRTRLADENLSPADMVLVDTLVRYIGLELARQVGGDNLDPDQKLVVDKVLSWVIAAATITQPEVTADPTS